MCCRQFICLKKNGKEATLPDAGDNASALLLNESGAIVSDLLTADGGLSSATEAAALPESQPDLAGEAPEAVRDREEDG